LKRSGCAFYGIIRVGQHKDEFLVFHSRLLIGRSTQLLVCASAIVAVPAAAPLHCQNGKLLSGKERNILPDRLSLGPMHRYPHLVQPAQRACADPADDDRIDLLVIERLHGIARPMGMMLVPVMDGRDPVRFRVHDHEYGCGAKMVVHAAVEAFILLYGKTDLHVMFLLGFTPIQKRWLCPC
jgi:hypothetical protein